MTDKKDEQLWKIVTKGVKPLKGKAVRTKDEAVKAENKTPPEKQIRAKAPLEILPPVIKPVHTDPALGLDRRTRDKIKKGKMPIEGRLDLHGMSQARAHEALQVFIFNAFENQKRTVLVITGKGRAENGSLRDPLQRGDGVLRKRVPEWLSVSPFKEMVLKVHEAKPEHGGSGALYVYLRRDRAKG